MHTADMSVRYTFVLRPQANVKSALILTNHTHMDIRSVLAEI